MKKAHVTSNHKQIITFQRSNQQGVDIDTEPINPPIVCEILSFACKKMGMLLIIEEKRKVQCAFFQ